MNKLRFWLIDRLLRWYANRYVRGRGWVKMSRAVKIVYEVDGKNKRYAAFDVEPTASRMAIAQTLDQTLTHIRGELMDRLCSKPPSPAEAGAQG